MEPGRTKTAIQIGVGLALCAITVGGGAVVLQQHRKAVVRTALYHEVSTAISEFKTDLTHGFQRNDIAEHQKKLRLLIHRTNPKLPSEISVALISCNLKIDAYFHFQSRRVDPLEPLAAPMSPSREARRKELLAKDKRMVDLISYPETPEGWEMKSAAYWAHRSLQSLYEDLEQTESLLEE